MSATIPTAVSKKHHNELAYHKVRETIVIQSRGFRQNNIKYKSADVLSKHIGSSVSLTKPLMFWTWCDDDETKIREKRGV